MTFEEATNIVYRIVIPEEERWKIPSKDNPSSHGDTYSYDRVKGNILCGISKDAVYFKPLGAPMGKYVGVPIAWLKEEQNEDSPGH